MLSQNNESGEIKTSEVVNTRPGDALLFNGSTFHRDVFNNGDKHRYVYYVSYSDSPIPILQMPMSST
jgi:hypothetical protein